MRGRLLSGEPPTVREVQEAMGFSAVQTARQHLEALVADGRLASGQGRARGYRLAASPGGIARWAPLLGRVRAGALTEAIQDVEDYVPVMRQGELFALRVEGESMTGAGILPGDVVIVKRGVEARAGDIVVALVGDEATVKRLRLAGRRVELHAENPAFAPIVPEPGAVSILGKVVEVRRILDGAGRG
ncbi:MAG: transcriptional repressor LexA [Acidobacteriota bacterium]